MLIKSMTVKMKFYSTAVQVSSQEQATITTIKFEFTQSQEANAWNV